MNFKRLLSNVNKRDFLHWFVFVAFALTITLKVIEVSAYESLKLLVDTPELAQYSYLIN